MQFPVPQFTDVEDKIIGPLTLKQFGIIFAAGVVVFLGYSASAKSIPVMIVLLLVVGLPAMAMAFIKYNGRPIYNTFGQIFRFVTAEKILKFHKEVYGLGERKLKDAKISTDQAAATDANSKDPKARLKELQSILQKESAEEKELIGKIR